jgi:hypothetical protein
MSSGCLKYFQASKLYVTGAYPVNGFWGGKRAHGVSFKTKAEQI